MLPPEPLSDLEERFANEWIKDLNGTQAYLRVKPEVKATTARAEASKLLAKPNVYEYVQALKSAQFDRLQIESDRVLQEMAIVAFSDPRDYTVDEAGNLALTPQAHPLATRAVSSVKHKTTTTGSGDAERTIREVEYRLWDKPAALRMLGQHKKLLSETLVHEAGASWFLPVHQPLPPEEWAERAKLLGRPQGALTPGNGDSEAT